MVAENKSLLFIPDISGYTKFVQTTEAEHSQHVIAELLEVLLEANTQDLMLAEVEGDALFFYKLDELPSQEKLLAQVETMFSAFHSHLKKLQKNRICPCAACATAPELKLKIVAHSAELQFLEVKGNRKPFGPEVIEAHRLLKNSVNSENYVLISRELASHIGMPFDYKSKVFSFNGGSDLYDGHEVQYIYALINQQSLNLNEFDRAPEIEIDGSPKMIFEKTYRVSADELFEYITNYTYRHYWVKGVDKFEYKENEVTRLGSEHVCVVNGKHLNIEVVIKKAAEGDLVYGEMTRSIPVFDVFYQFYTISPVNPGQCQLKLEVYWKTPSLFKKIIVALVAKRSFKKSGAIALEKLEELVGHPR